MRRLGVTLAHLLALPVGALLSLAVLARIPPSPAVETALHDTYFVVAHFHTSVILGCALLVATAVAFRYGRVNWGLKAAWGLGALHVLSAILLPDVPDVLVGEADSSVLLHESPLPGVFFVASATAALLATALGLVVSLVRAWKSQPPELVSQ